MKFGRRHMIAILCLCSTMTAYIGRTNLSTAIVSMTESSHKKNNVSVEEINDVCPDPDDSEYENSTKSFTNLWLKTNADTTKALSTNKAKTFDWDEKTQGLILGAFFYGYFFLQLMGGRMAEKFGPRILCTVGLSGSGLINLITPWIAGQKHVFMASRVLLGALQATIYPSCYALTSHWIPDHERSVINSMAYIGGNLGQVISSLMAGYLCEYFDWPTVFYVSGALIVLFSIVYFLWVRDDPRQDHKVSEQELMFIHSNIKTSPNNIGQQNVEELKIDKKTKASFPWRKFLTNKSILVGIFVHFTSIWSLTVLALKIPDYIHRVLRIPLSKNGMYTSAMMLAEGFCLFFGGMTADHLLKSGRFRKTTIRKAFQTIAQLGGAICLMFVPVADCNPTTFLLAMVLSSMFNGLQSGGVIPLPLDLSNEFSATTFAIFNTVGMTNGFICPYIIGYILDSDPHHTKHKWWIVFYITIGVRLAGATVFALFGQTDRLDWTNDKDEQTESEIEKGEARF